MRTLLLFATGCGTPAPRRTVRELTGPEYALLGVTVEVEAGVLDREIVRTVEACGGRRFEIDRKVHELPTGQEWPERSETFANGSVIANGRYFSPPYDVRTRDGAITINGEPSCGRLQELVNIWAPPAPNPGVTRREQPWISC